MEVELREVEIRSGTGSAEPDGDDFDRRWSGEIQLGGSGWARDGEQHGVQHENRGGDTGALGILYGDTISVTETSPGHLVGVIKKNGKVTITAHGDVAADGKSRTVTYSGKTAEGKEIKDKLVYDKVM